MNLKFSTKAKTLASLTDFLQTANVAPMHSFSVAEWNLDRQACIDGVLTTLGATTYIVRSSSSREDELEASNAGAFLSMLDVNHEGLENAVEKVVEAYGKVNGEDEVLIQPMLNQVLRSGVAFSHDPNTCAPYRVVNWSEGTDTSIVTAGLGGRVWQAAANSPVLPPAHLKPVLDLINELLEAFNNLPLDCEFAVTLEDGIEVLWLLQARPLILSNAPQTSAEQFERLKSIQNKIERGMQPHPFLMGSRTVYGVMPDWNPAEIVGIRPKPLALSLYRDLITDTIWAYQRNNYGYRNLRSFPLMPHFCGLPYIDVQVSFNSFIPSDLDNGLAGRLVDHYIDQLLAEPTLHDKVEFEIVFSCYTLDLPQRLESLAEAGFSKQEQETIAESLLNITNRIVHPEKGLWRSDARKIGILNARREELLASQVDPLARIYWLLEDAKRYGTLPFAGLARAGFIAVQMLKSFVSVGVFSQYDYDTFIKGVSTVSGQLASDRADLAKSTFLSRYGHLRPGTYDILSPRYDEAPELYFDWSNPPSKPEPVSPFSLTSLQMREIAQLLKAHGLVPDPVGLLEFMQSGIELRESSKFHFTRNLSDALALISAVGADYGFTPEELAFCDISAFKELHVAATDTKDTLHRAIDLGKSRYAETLKISLPPLIATPEDIWAFEWPASEPNFITQKQVMASVVGCDELKLLDGAIVFIPNADPGFDWLFSYSIAGLVTAWGGANSHMAIRAGELGLPAVIGAGEILYRQWSEASRLRIDCASRQVEILI